MWLSNLLVVFQNFSLKIHNMISLMGAEWCVVCVRTRGGQQGRRKWKAMVERKGRRKERKKLRERERELGKREEKGA